MTDDWLKKADEQREQKQRETDPAMPNGKLATRRFLKQAKARS